MPSATGPEWESYVAPGRCDIRSVPIYVFQRQVIYLDNNATTRLSAHVAATMNELMRLRLANPSSQHSAGRQARQIVERARESILRNCGARMHGMASDQLLFTSGGTESNNLAIFGLTESKPGVVVVSAIEHPSVLACAEYLSTHQRTVRYLPCDRNGVVQLSALQQLLDEHRQGMEIAMVSIMLANNETGVLQPVATAAKWCREHGVLIHTDASQVLGKLTLDFASLDVDAMTITAHKLHGPVGIGGLVLKQGVQPSPQSFGGFQQLGLRPGTEMAVLCGGFEAAVLDSCPSIDERTRSTQQLRESLETLIQASIDDCIINGRDASRLPHTLSISFPGVDRQALQLALDMAGIACSTGSACASGSSQPSHVLQAMQLPDAVIRGGIRFSLSAENTSLDIEQTVEALRSIVPRLRK
ncbi:MAG: cysteine desulfurase family protein [Pirellula sp.]